MSRNRLELISSILPSFLIAGVVGLSAMSAAAQMSVSIGGATVADGGSGDLTGKRDGNIRFEASGPGYEASGNVIQSRNGSRRSLRLTNFEIRNTSNQPIVVPLCMQSQNFTQKGCIVARFWMKGQFRGPRGDSSVTMSGAVDGKAIPPGTLTASRSNGDRICCRSPRQKRRWTAANSTGHWLSGKLQFRLAPGNRVQFPNSAWIDIFPSGGQGAVPPVAVDAPKRRAGLHPPSVPAKAVRDLHMVAHPDRRGSFLTALTVVDLPAKFGGTGKGLDVLTGIYNPATDTFVADRHAAALNTTGAEWGLSLHSSGLIATWKVFARGVFLATRTSLTAPFVVQGMLPETSLFRDPALATIGDELYLLYAESSVDQIMLAPLDLPGLAVGDPIAVVGGARPNSEPSAPKPIVDSNGQLLGLSFLDTLARDRDHYLALDLDIDTAAVPVFDTPGMIGGGAQAGGTFYYIDDTLPAQPVIGLDTIWWTGGAGAFGSSVPVTSHMPIGHPAFSFFLLSPSFIDPQPIPGLGLLGVSPGLLLPIGPHDPLTGSASTLLPIPPTPGLEGFALATQSVVIDPIAGQIDLGNTATIRIHAPK